MLPLILFKLKFSGNLLFVRLFKFIDALKFSSYNYFCKYEV